MGKPDYLEKYNELPEWLQKKINKEPVNSDGTLNKSLFDNSADIDGDPDFDDTVKDDIPF